MAWCAFRRQYLAQEEEEEEEKERYIKKEARSVIKTISFHLSVDVVGQSNQARSMPGLSLSWVAMVKCCSW
jgi:hypothetical protein